MTIRFAAVGLNHGHIYSMCDRLIEAGAELVWYYAKEPQLANEFGAKYPSAQLARSEEEVLEDTSIALIASAGIPYDRAPLGIRAMQHSKDYASDKPGFTSFDQLAEVKRVQAETGRIYSVCFSERFDNRAAIKAGELVHSGAIGKVIQTIGLGPHRLSAPTRPDWFWDRRHYSGIINDIASHQMDQFLFYTGSSSARIVAAQVGNFNHPQYPDFDDFGDALLSSDHATGYTRVDWFTPDGLETWGDGRMTILGTSGTIELRKYVDIAGRSGGNHLFLVDNQKTEYIDCSQVAFTYGQTLIYDILHRTETTMTHAHCFEASRLALQASQEAIRVGIG
jgi:predicted dehydrogenase